jgi:phenylacetic acid degradation operon negative regulatory protein
VSPQCAPSVTAVNEAEYAAPVPVAGEVLGEPQPRHLIVTVYGLYARDAEGWLPVAGLVRLLSELGIGPQAVRSSISRLKRRDALRSLRRGGAAGYVLAPSMAEVLREGDRRIFGHLPATPDDGWVQVVFTVPEAQRAKRHEVRSRLAGLGFGPMAPGVWVAPGALADEVRVALARQGLTGFVDLFRGQYLGGEHLGYAPLAARVRQWWDLPRIEAGYAAFVAGHRDLARRVARRPPSPGEAFAAYVRMLTVWRRLRYLDPGLPLELLPSGWKGAAAAELFERLRAALGPPAEAHARDVIRAVT